MTLPRDDGFFMPAEWAPHSRCWMAWPCREAVWGDHLDMAREAYAEVANAIAAFEPVTMIANPENLAEASLKCGTGVACLPIPHDDSWTRDTGPSFLINDRGELGGVAWQFNAWGGKYSNYEKDSKVASAILQHLELPVFLGDMILEGGSIHVDGEGTLLTSEQCLLNPNRNPNLSRSDIEEKLRGYLGVESIIWLNQGLVDDETDGHVDNLACFAAPGVVLALSCDDPNDENYAALQDNISRLRASSDAKGRPLEVIEVPQPARMNNDQGERLSRSYINFYIANGGIVMPSFEDSQDSRALDIIAGAFPDRSVVSVSATDITFGGGGIHCITQQQPLV